MATQINNSASISYSFGDSSDVSSSNIATTSLLDAYSLIATKLSHNINWRPGENITYVVRIENTGTETIYAVSLQDNLGGTPTQLAYIAGTAIENKGGVLTNLTPTSTSPLIFTLTSPLLSGEATSITYVAKVNGSIGFDITEITNTVAVSGHEVSPEGPTITVTPSPSITIPRADYANLKISKSVNKEQVSSGEELIYIFEIENSGNIEATNVVLTDSLPTGFTVQSITSKTADIITNYSPTDYTIDTNNTLVLPTSATKTLSVPAATMAGNGITTVTIVGIINS